MEAACETVIKYLKLNLDPSSSNDVRLNSHNFIESFKESSPYLLEIGLHLSFSQNSFEILYFGLTLIEFYVKFRWIGSDQITKVFIQNKLMNYFKDFIIQWQTAPNILMNTLAKVLVEIGKREWPNQWQAFLTELIEIAKGRMEIHCEIVLLILLTLSEDTVGQMDSNLPATNRKNLVQALNNSQNYIFNFFTQIASFLIGQFPNISNSHLTSRFILTLHAYFEWSPFTVIVDCELILLKFLQKLMSLAEFRLLSVECLLILASRKEIDMPERSKLLYFIEKDFLQTIGQIVDNMCSDPFNVDELEYSFFKHIAQFVSKCTIMQIKYPWMILPSQHSKVKTMENSKSQFSIEVFPNLDILLDLLIQFSQHPSNIVTLECIEAWLALLQENSFLQSNELKSRLKTLLNLFPFKQSKIGHPEYSHHPSCYFNRLDFEDDESFIQFNSIYKNHLSDLLGHLIRADITEAYIILIHWLNILLNENHKHFIPTTHASLLYIQWSSFVLFLSSCYQAWKSANESIQKYISKISLDILRQILTQKFDSDLLLIQIQINCISVLSNFLPYDEENTLKLVLSIIFRYLVYTDASSINEKMPKNCFIIRRLAVNCLSSLTKHCEIILIPFFDDIFNLYQKIVETMTVGQSTQVLETLFKLKMHSPMNEQISFIELILSPHVQYLLHDEIQTVLDGTIEHVIFFLNYDEKQLPNVTNQRVRLYNALKYMHTFLKVYSDLENIEIQTIREFLFQILCPKYFRLARFLLLLRSPLTQHLLHSDFQGFDKLDLEEKNSLTPIRSDCEFSMLNEEILCFENFINFLIRFTHTSISLLASFFISNSEFYSTENGIIILITENLLDFGCHNLIIIKTILRNFIQPFVFNCPAILYGKIIVPIIDHLLYAITSRLNSEWKILKELNLENFDQNSEVANQEEVLTHLLLTNISREYIKFIYTICYFKYSKMPTENNAYSMQNLLTQIGSIDEKDQKTTNEHETLNLLCRVHFLTNQSLLSNLISTLINAISWRDTTCTQKSATLLGLIFTHIGANFINEMTAGNLFYSVLNAIHFQGNDQTAFHHLVLLLVILFENLSKIYPQLINQTFRQIPKFDETKFQRLTDAFNTSGSELKSKCIAMKGIVEPIIRGELGDKWKNAPRIVKLPEQNYNKKKSYTNNHHRNPNHNNNNNTDNDLDFHLELLFI